MQWHIWNVISMLYVYFLYIVIEVVAFGRLSPIYAFVHSPRLYYISQKKLISKSEYYLYKVTYIHDVSLYRYVIQHRYDMLFNYYTTLHYITSCFYKAFLKHWTVAILLNNLKIIYTHIFFSLLSAFNSTFFGQFQIKNFLYKNVNAF